MCDDAARQDPGSGAVAGVVRAIAQGMEMKEEEQAALDSFVAGEDVEAIASSRRIDAALVLAQLAAAASILGPELPEPAWTRLIQEAFGEDGRDEASPESVQLLETPNQGKGAAGSEGRLDAGAGSSHRANGAGGPDSAVSAGKFSPQATSATARAKGFAHRAIGEADLNHGHVDGSQCVVEVEEVSAEELAMLEDAIYAAEASAEASRAASQDRDSSGSCEISYCGEESSAPAPALSKEAVLQYIVRGRGGGVSLEQLAQHFGIPAGEQLGVLEQIIAQLEEDADVYREGPNMLFPI